MAMVGGGFVAGGLLLDFDLRLVEKNFFSGESDFASSGSSCSDGCDAIQLIYNLLFLNIQILNLKIREFDHI